jgi:hypothetical protein
MRTGEDVRPPRAAAQQRSAVQSRPLPLVSSLSLSLAIILVPRSSALLQCCGLHPTGTVNVHSTARQPSRATGRGASESDHRVHWELTWNGVCD